jgi:membrane protein YqaA with SNARE-associated domain
MPDLTAYFSLFFAALAAATILPMQSEVLLAGLLLTGNHMPWLLVLIASVGNVMGSVVNWFLGRSLERFHDKKWFPVKPAQLHRAQRWYVRYGRWSLLLSWVPLIGDPLTVAAGIMRERLVVFTAIIAVAKVARYIVVAYAALKMA